MYDFLSLYSTSKYKSRPKLANQNLNQNVPKYHVKHETKRITSRNPPWITKALKPCLIEKNRLFKNFKGHGYQETDKIRVDNFRKECQDVVDTAKQTYILNLGNKLINLKTREKSYWRILNKVTNKWYQKYLPFL